MDIPLDLSFVPNNLYFDSSQYYLVQQLCEGGKREQERG